MNKVKNLLDINQDGKVDMSDLYFIIAEVMKDQKKLKISGSDKKDNVLKTLKNIIGVHLYERFEPVLEPAIDFIIVIANNKTILKHLKKNCIALPCCK